MTVTELYESIHAEWLKAIALSEYAFSIKDTTNEHYWGGVADGLYKTMELLKH